MIKNKKTILLVLSCLSLTTSIGYSTFVLPSNSQFVVNNIDTKTKPIAYIVGNDKIKFSTIEKALDYAKSGDIVCVIPPTTGSVSYKITRDCEIKEGVSLVLPTSEASFSSVQDGETLNSYIQGMIEVPDGPGTTSKATEKNLKTSVIVGKDVTITNNGNIVVSGVLTGGNNNAGSLGQTAGDYSKIVLSSGAKIKQNTSTSANIYCFGFIDEESTNNSSSIIMETGNIYLPFVVKDYRGFNYSYALSQGGGVSEMGCSAFNQYEFPNVTSSLNVSKTGAVKGIVNILISFSSVGVNNLVSHSTMDLVGKSSSDFICLTENGTFNYKYNKSTGLASIEIIDGCTIGNLAFKATVKGFTADMNTKTAYFPIPYNFSIKLTSSSDSSKAIFNSTKQKMKFLPGSSLEVGANCTLTMAETAIYSAFVDGSVGNGKTYSHTCNSMAYPIKPGAIFKIDSTSTLSATAIGGIVYCDNESNVVSTSNLTVCNEPWSIGGGLVPSFTEYLEIREAKKVVPISYLNKKKAYFFSNTFLENETLLPKTQILINQSEIDIVDGTQSVLFIDNIDNYQLNFINNVYNSLYLSNILNGKLQSYPYKEEIQASNNDILIGVVNSTVSISSSNNSINEFEVQSISITSTQDKIDGKDPLYPGKNLGLKANLVDDTKIYNPIVTWSTSDSNVATVDSNGLVTGISLGTVTIYAECGGKKASYETEVIEEHLIVDVTNMYLQSSNAKKSNEFNGTSNIAGTANNGSKDFSYNEKVTKNNTTLTVSFVVEPEDATITGLKWEYASWGDKSYMMESSSSSKKYYKKVDGNIGGENDNSCKSVLLTFDGDVGASPDSETLTCTVYYGDGNTYTLTFIIDYTYTATCILPTARVLMGDGTYKEASLICTGDIIISFNHENGKFERNKVIGNDHLNKPACDYNVINLEFSNNKSTDFINEHGYFDVTLNRYVYLHEQDASNYIGHYFAFYENGIIATSRLDKVTKRTMYTTIVCPATANHLNFIVDDILNIGGGLLGLFNIFEYNPNTLAFDKDKMQKDIDKYGLLDYEVFKNYFPKEIYDLLPCKYLGVSIGKGLITWEIFNDYVVKWKEQLLENIKE